VRLLVDIPGTLEERLGSLFGNDLRAGIEHGLVVNSAARSHHHTTTDGIERIRSKTSADSNTPAEEERGEERALESTDEDDRLEGVVHTKAVASSQRQGDSKGDRGNSLETTVDNDTNN
jgi:hypothetical protein